MKKIPYFRSRSLFYFFFIGLFSILIVGCKYYKVSKVAPEEISKKIDIDNSDKLYIIHHHQKEYILTDLKIESNQIFGEIIKPTPFQKIYYSSQNENKKIKNEERNILREVHFYLMNKGSALEEGEIEIPFKDIYEIHIVKQDKGATAFYVTTGILAGGIVAIIAGTSGSKSDSSKPSTTTSSEEGSCPYVYVNNGQQYVMEGEAYAGAILQNMERDDYMPLPSIQTVNQEYQIKMSNELQERHYTNLARLIVVNHPKDNKVLLDKYGNPQLISNPYTPLNISSLNGQNLSPILESKDRNVFFFNEKESNRNGVLLTFKKPNNTTQGKLVLNGNNTLWLGSLYAQFTSQFGKRFNKWMDRQSNKSTKKGHRSMLNSDFPLSIYIKEKGEWNRVDYLYPVGTFPDRDMVVPIDFSNVEEDQVEIKIESGFMFWELDYVALDFSENRRMQLTSISPAFAKDNEGNNWKAALDQNDETYMPQLNIGNETILKYPAVEHSIHETQTVFLHTRGYYELIRDYEGRPNVRDLKKFKKPGYFSEYSRSQFLKFCENNGVNNTMASK